MANQDVISYGNGWNFDPQSQKFTNTQNGQRLSQDDYNLLLRKNEENKQADIHHQQMLAQGLNDDGSPIKKAFDTIAKDNGELQDAYQMNISGLDPSQYEGFQKYKGEAMRTGPSAWAGLQGQQIDATTLANKEAAARQAQGGMNAANANLAMRGGLSAGARGLAARQSTRDMLMARQQAARAGDQNKLQVATTDEGNRIGQLANLASTEQNMGQYNKTLESKQKEFNIQNMLQEQQAKRAYNENTYNKQMETWAANKQAQATAASGGGGGKK